MNDFVHLRVSSEYSIFKGLPSPKAFAAEAAKQSMPMLAITDQSNMFGAVKFFSECEKGVKPISGTVLKSLITILVRFMKFFALLKIEMVKKT